MSESHPNPRRVLAAIVFTDVVSYSKHMSQNEDGTLRAVDRDFRMMGRACEAFDGQILKNTGDGLLMYFSSAVQAVSCALRIQQQLALEDDKPRPGPQLKHRIGIHLGDVFLSDNDVVGDGVNIASRLQATAEPGGICISQTVYDVVKNRLQLQTTSLGPQELKNIQGKVPVYRILMDASAPTAGTAGLEDDAAADRWKRYRTPAMVAAGVLLLLVAAWGGYELATPDTTGDDVASASPPAVQPQQLAAPGPPGDAPEVRQPAPEPPPAGDPPQQDSPSEQDTPVQPPPLQEPEQQPSEQPRQFRPRQRTQDDQRPRPAQRTGGPPSVDRIFSHIDRNNDGVIERHEIPAEHRDRMMEADTNNDGRITRQELETHHANLPGGQQPPPPPNQDN